MHLLNQPPEKHRTSSTELTNPTSQVEECPYGVSDFLPGWSKRRPTQFLIDISCTTNLPSNTICEWLADKTKTTLDESQTQLSFYGIIGLPIWVRDTRVEEVFVVSRISKTILGMPFLSAHNCSLDFARSVLRVDGRDLICTDRYGRLLMSNVKVTREMVIPPRTETALLCRHMARASALLAR